MGEWTFNGVEFKVGDKVKIVRKVQTKVNGMGFGKDWRNGWVSSMTYSIGNIAEITKINDTGVRLKGEGFGWPLAALEKQRVELPTSMFKLIDEEGIIYTLSENNGLGYIAMYPAMIEGATARTALTKAQVLSSIESGFWILHDPEALERKEAKLAELVKQHDLLTNEINKLEEEIAQW